MTLVEKFQFCDLLYGFHFSFKYLSRIKHGPFQASIRVLNICDDNEMKEKCYGKEYVFTVLKENEEDVNNTYKVDAQLPLEFCLSRTRNKKNEQIFVCIRDKHEDVILDIEINTFWLQLQKEKLLQRKAVDFLKCSMYNPSQMERVHFKKEKHRGLFWIRRLGSRVGNEMECTLVSDEITDYNFILYEKHFEEYRKWLYTFCPFAHFAFLVGHKFMPLTALLCLADTKDEWSFEHIGWIQTQCYEKIWIQDWNKDWNDTFVFLSGIHNSRSINTFWKAVELMSCNSTCIKKATFPKDALPFPQLNSIHRNDVDQLASALFIVDFLYHKIHSKSSPRPLGLEKLLTHWPCIAVATDIDGCVQLYYGLVKRDVLNAIVTEEKLSPNTKVKLFSPSLTKETSKFLLFCWKDYEYNCLCSALLFERHIEGRIGVGTFSSFPGNKILFEEGFRAEVYIQNYVEIKQWFTHEFHVNGPKTLRNIVDIGSIIMETNTCPKIWHKGYVTETKCQWSKEHVYAWFDVGRTLAL
jgi:hypothetical protein